MIEKDTAAAEKVIKQAMIQHDIALIDGYQEILNTTSMTVGVLTLSTGALDTQTPHDEDEIYYVISGDGRFTLGDDDFSVSPGHVIFVKAGIAHCYHTATKDLVVLVIKTLPGRTITQEPKGPGEHHDPKFPPESIHYGMWSIPLKFLPIPITPQDSCPRVA